MMCRDANEQILIDNLNAAIQYAISAVGWDLSISEVAEVVSLITEESKTIGSNLTNPLIETYLTAVHDPREVVGFVWTVKRCL
jgi:hypothetical protein